MTDNVNGASKSMPSLPRSRRQKLQVKLPHWPEIDRNLWNAATGPADLLGETNPASAWAPATKRIVSKSYGRWLGWLSATNQLDPAAIPSERATPDRVAAYVDALRATGASTTVMSYMHSLTMALTAMVPDADFTWLWQVVRRLQRAAVPSRRKADRIVPVKELLAFGLELMTEASDRCRETTVQRAARYRNGLLIAILALRPIRIRNLQMMELGTHLQRLSDRYYLRFMAGETKTRRPVDLAMPDSFTGLIDTYLSVHRPTLLAQRRSDGSADAAEDPSAAVWISVFGRQMPVISIFERIAELTRRKFGKSVNPHLFRDCAATSIALDDPDHVHITVSILGHTSLATSERYYNHALSRNAASFHQTEIAGLRRAGRKRCVPKAPPRNQCDNCSTFAESRFRHRP